MLPSLRHTYIHHGTRHTYHIVCSIFSWIQHDICASDNACSNYNIILFIWTLSTNHVTVLSGWVAISHWDAMQFADWPIPGCSAICGLRLGLGFLEGTGVELVSLYRLTCT